MITSDVLLLVSLGIFMYYSKMSKLVHSTNQVNDTPADVLLHKGVVRRENPQFYNVR